MFFFSVDFFTIATFSLSFFLLEENIDVSANRGGGHLEVSVCVCVWVAQAVRVAFKLLRLILFRSLLFKIFYPTPPPFKVLNRHNIGTVFTYIIL